MKLNMTKCYDFIKLNGGCLVVCYFLLLTFSMKYFVLK